MLIIIMNSMVLSSQASLNSSVKISFTMNSETTGSEVNFDAIMGNTLFTNLSNIINLNLTSKNFLKDINTENKIIELVIQNISLTIELLDDKFQLKDTKEITKTDLGLKYTLEGQSNIIPVEVFIPEGIYYLKCKIIIDGLVKEENQNKENSIFEITSGPLGFIIEVDSYFNGETGGSSSGRLVDLLVIVLAVSLVVIVIIGWKHFE